MNTSLQQIVKNTIIEKMEWNNVHKEKKRKEKRKGEGNSCGKK
jgi:hypothetical protein